MPARSERKYRNNYTISPCCKYHHHKRRQINSNNARSPDQPLFADATSEVLQTCGALLALAEETNLIAARTAIFIVWANTSRKW